VRISLIELVSISLGCRLLPTRYAAKLRQNVHIARKLVKVFVANIAHVAAEQLWLVSENSLRFGVTVSTKVATAAANDGFQALIGKVRVFWVSRFSFLSKVGGRFLVSAVVQ
jgi:hypothetical protein